MKDKIQWISNLRVLATFCVILLHVAAGNFMHTFSIPVTAYWWAANVYDSITHFAVPVFIMISGALLLPQEISLGKFLKKRFAHILLPFVFWNIVYIALCFFGKGYYTDFTFFETVKDLIVKLLTCKISVHFWFVYMLAGLYLFMPILSKWIRHSTEKEILYFLVLWFITVNLGNIPVFYAQMGYISSKLVNFSGFAGYLVFGYYLSTKKFPLKNKTQLLLAAALCLCAMAFTVLFTYRESLKTNHGNERFMYLFYFNIILMAASVSMFLKNLPSFKNKVILLIISALDKYSYGIFLIHLLVLNYMQQFGIGGWFSPYIDFPLRAALCMAVSWLVIYLLNKIPLLKNFTG
ncbi:MAG: acyltransferase family protein [Paludibacter sp.]|jgi:surface polysaccharide O-acyltransferase-like enzyme|nr:acyltransferase family protein [Paludibacter sp.]